MRRGPPTILKATPEVARPWRDLIGAARTAASAAPSSAQPDFATRARAAKRLPVPGVLTEANACVRLSRMARRYLGETTAGRRALQAELTAAADAAAEHLDGEEEAVRAERKDLDQ